MNMKRIREFKDKEGNEYVIYKKANGHVELVKFKGAEGKTVATNKEDIFLYLKKLYKENNLKECK